MLKYLCLARIAVEVKKAGKHLLSGIAGESEEVGVGYSERLGMDKAKFEAELKKQNDWAWKEPTEDIRDDDEDDDEESAIGLEPDATVSLPAALIPLSEEERTRGIKLIISDCRIVDGNKNDTAEKLRLLSPYAGAVALFI